MPAPLASDLAEELYALMQEPRGATIEAIRSKPCLMGLSFIRAQAPLSDGADVREEAIAATGQTIIRQTTFDLDKPIPERELDNDVDFGAAARVFLALEKGTERLSLAERRKRAARYTDKKVRTMAKTQTSEGRRGHEYHLMLTLAQKLADLEIHSQSALELPPFDASFVDGSVALWTTRPLPDYHRAWSIACLFPDHIGVALDCVRSRSALWHEGAKCPRCLPSIGTHARFVTVTEEVGEPDKWGMLRKETFPARGLVARIRRLAPFSVSECRLLERGISTATTYRELAELFGESIFMKWDTWLRTCTCRQNRHAQSCQVNTATLAYREYAVTLESEWQRLQQQLHASSPAEFVEYNERIAFGRAGLRLPSTPDNQEK